MTGTTRIEHDKPVERYGQNNQRHRHLCTYRTNNHAFTDVTNNYHLVAVKVGN